jgi:hypothetical protein
MDVTRLILMSARMCSFVIVFSIIAGCSSQSQPADALIARASNSEFGNGAYGCADTISVAAQAGVDYKCAVDGAARGNLRSLHTLFWLSANAGFDAASSEGNAAVLGNVLRYVGDGTFGPALTREPPATRQAVQDDLRYDFGVGEDGVKESWLTEWYPLTFEKQAKK